MHHIYLLLYTPISGCLTRQTRCLQMCFQGEKTFHFGRWRALRGRGVWSSLSYTQMSQRQRSEEVEGMKTPTNPLLTEVNRATFFNYNSCFHSICFVRWWNNCRVGREKQFISTPLSSAPHMYLPRSHCCGATHVMWSSTSEKVTEQKQSIFCFSVCI